MDYTKVIVNKPWGWETCIYQTPECEVWLLYLKKGEKTSMHAHPNKKTALAIVGGSAKVNLLSTTLSLLPGEKINIRPGVFHQTESWSAEGTYLIEMEVPPDKSNLVRMRDKYGRVGKGYETEYIDRTDFSQNLALDKTVQIGECCLDISQPKETIINWETHLGTEYIGDLRYLDSYQSLFILEGSLRCKNFPVLGCGDATDPRILKELSAEFGYSPLKILGIRRC